MKSLKSWAQFWFTALTMFMVSDLAFAGNFGSPVAILDKITQNNTITSLITIAFAYLTFSQLIDLWDAVSTGSNIVKTAIKFLAYLAITAWWKEMITWIVATATSFS